jgi:hypothetical protein
MRLKCPTLSAVTATMTSMTRTRRRPRPRLYLVSVTDYWRVAGPQQGRQVLVRDAGGDLRTVYLADDHPALVAFLERAAAVAA